MKRIDVGNLLSSASNVAMFSDKLANAAAELDDVGKGQLDLRELGGVYLRSLAYITETAQWLDLPTTLAAANRCRSAFGRLTGAGGVVVGRSLISEIVSNSHQLTVSLSDELAKHHTYVVAPREGELIDQGIGLFDLDVVNALPSIRQDVSDGAKCRAYELWTASVMHMMRVAEVGVAALAGHLGVPVGSSWGMTIADVLQALDKERRAKGDPELKQWASEIATYLNFVKDAFRNPAMHPEMSFDRDQAISIYDNTRSFMRTLVRRLGANPAR